MDDTTPEAAAPPQFAMDDEADMGALITELSAVFARHNVAAALAITSINSGVTQLCFPTWSTVQVKDGALDIHIPEATEPDRARASVGLLAKLAHMSGLLATDLAEHIRAVGPSGPPPPGQGRIILPGAPSVPPDLRNLPGLPRR